MAQAYPVELQECFSRGTFQRVPGNNVIYSETDTGPSKSRRRSTLAKDLIRGQIILKDNNEYSVFYTWFKQTLQDGVLSFDFKDPVTQNTIEVKFQSSRWSLSDIGFQTYSVQFNLEVVSE